ncbi:MAG: helix-turn-helix transcriptional regulator [Raineya sp.]|jgi:transcriptional regulator with XRE-family HTH domain|nr:helix-turn-helix transcriptional regulator [Raineya sp.]
MLSVPHKIIQIRKEKGYTQEYVAEMLGISQSAYHKIESGRASLKLEQALKLAQVFEKSLEDFLPENSNYFNIYNNKENSVNGLNITNNIDIEKLIAPLQAVINGLLEQNATKDAIIQKLVAQNEELLKKLMES